MYLGCSGRDSTAARLASGGAGLPGVDDDAAGGSNLEGEVTEPFLVLHRRRAALMSTTWPRKRSDDTNHAHFSGLGWMNMSATKRLNRALRRNSTRISAPRFSKIPSSVLLAALLARLTLDVKRVRRDLHFAWPAGARSSAT